METLLTRVQVLQASKQPIQFNMGCGNDIRTDYINIDINQSTKADFHLDITQIHMQNIANRILAFDILEHFQQSQTIPILQQWYILLKQGGILELRVPDLYNICSEFLKGTLPFFIAQWLIYGGQETPGNFHFAGFTAEYLEGLLIGVGFKKIIQIVKKDHNIILLAEK